MERGKDWQADSHVEERETNEGQIGKESKMSLNSQLQSTTT